MDLFIIFLILVLLGCLFFTYIIYVEFEFDIFIRKVVLNFWLSIFSVVLCIFLTKTIVIFELIGIFLSAYFCYCLCDVYLDIVNKQ